MADDISNPNAANSGQNGDLPPDGDTTAPLERPTLSKGLMAELTRFFNLCNAVDDIADHRDALNAIANAHYAALDNHEQATNVDMHTIDLDVLTSLDDHVEWFRLNNMALENVPEIYSLSSNVVAREEELTAIERDIRDRFGDELTENVEAEMVVQFEDVARDLAFNRDGLLARCRAILVVENSCPLGGSMSAFSTHISRPPLVKHHYSLLNFHKSPQPWDGISKDTDQSAADAATTEEPKRFFRQQIIMSTTLKTQLDDFAETDREVEAHLSKICIISRQAYAARKAVRRHQRRTRTDPQTIDLDNITTLDNHIRLLDLQDRYVKHETERNAEVRLVFTKLDKLAALGTEIMANHSSELGEKPTEFREWFAERRESIARDRAMFSEVFRTIVFQNL
ncbi:hypothetical protein KCU78_g2102, partial [Aureobasidium melanogenum]